jgi:hypothetical protein
MPKFQVGLSACRRPDRWAPDAAGAAILIGGSVWPFRHVRRCSRRQDTGHE